MPSKYLAEFESLQLSKLQQRAVDRLCSRIAENCESVGSKFGHQITEVTLDDAAFNGSYWLTVKTEHTLSPGTLLSALCDEHWFVLVGPRGGLRAKSYPKSFKQFIGDRKVSYMGCRFDK